MLPQLVHQLVSVRLVLHEQANSHRLEHLGSVISSFLGPSPTLSLSYACRFNSLQLLNWIWASSCTSPDTRAPNWTLNNYLRSERQYYLWQFRKSAEVAAECGNVDMMKWLFGHFSNCFVPVGVVEAAAKKGHLPILKFLLENDAGRHYPHSHMPMVVTGGIVPHQSVPEISDEEQGEGIVVHWGGRSMLHSIEQKHVEIAKWLCQNSPHKMDNDEIRWAVEYSLRVPDMELARFFLPQGRSIVEFSHDDPDPEVVETLLEEGYTRLDEHCAAVSIYMLARVGRLDLMHRIVQLHSPPRARPRFDWSSEWFFATKEACKFGDVSVVKWLMEHPVGLRVAEAYQHHHSAGPEHFFCLAAEGGHLAVMKYLHEQGYSDNFKDAAVLAVRNNHLDTLKWLLDTHDFHTYGFMVEEAARHRRISILQFFHHNISSGDREFLPPFRHAIDVAATNGHLDTVKWLHETRSDGCTSLAMNSAAGNGHLDVVKWLHANRTEGCTTRAMDRAAGNGHLEMVEWLHRNRSEGCTTNAMDLAAANGYLKVVKWLYVNRSEGCTVKAFEKAMQNNHLRVAWWLHARYPKWNPSIDTLQIKPPDQFDILLFLDEHFPNIYDTQDYDQPVLAVVTEPDDRHAMTWMREKHNIIIEDHDP
ncbi:hypothetical protein F441_19902 [Phytophthora nicotianae CJ01A1]|uniref:Uncharacterized protein n=2 Tax=Phytophthora nicotianae TaxID=4792 RepID=W2VXS3_PHYNI|nr:hypothetical protein L915_19481 [Phytophthora nicotianae]ETP03105.1 hypothetical protein F441_19902 [Phytophthora nicotianae CJ01A1]